MTDRKRVKGFLKISLIILVVVIIGGYTMFRAKTITEGPNISVTEPINGSTVLNPLVKIIGTAKNISFINLNGAQIFTDESGNFSEEILLSNGYNIITLEAEDRFGRKTETSLKIIYK